METESAQMKAVHRILCDVPPGEPSDAVYLFAQTSDNQESVICAAVKILAEGLASRILVLDSPPYAGYAGYALWQEKLVASGIAAKRILSVELCTANHNTLTEAEAVIRYAKQYDFKRIIISAPAFHQVRAFMTTVAAALAEYPQLKIYSLPGYALSWNEKAIHSQGQLKARRSDLIQGEFDRIEKYYRKGDLISFDQVLDYLDKRDHKIP